MKLLKDIKDIYRGKNNLLNHVSLFSLLGIMTLCLYNRISSWSGNVFGEYFGYSSYNETELYLCGVAGVVILFFSFGYLLKCVNGFHRDIAVLPDLSLSVFVTFVRALLVFIYWVISIGVLTALGILLFENNSVLFYIYYSLLLCILPFINIIYIMFAKDFSYKNEYFNPLFLFKIMDKMLGSVIFLSLKLLPVCIFCALIVFVIFYFSAKVSTHNGQIVLRLLGLCVSVYFAYIINILYGAEVVKIIKEKLD